MQGELLNKGKGPVHLTFFVWNSENKSVALDILKWSNNHVGVYEVFLNADPVIQILNVTKTESIFLGFKQIFKILQNAHLVTIFCFIKVPVSLLFTIDQYPLQ